MNEREQQFHDVFTAGGKALVFEPATFRFQFEGKRAKYTPDFYCPETGIFYELVGSRQAFYANRHRMAAFVKTYPTIKFEIVNPDGSLHEWNDDYRQDGPIVRGEEVRRLEKPRTIKVRPVVEIKGNGSTMESKQAAAILGITVHGVRDHIARGNLRSELVPDMRGGRVWSIRREDVEELARRREGK